MKKTVKRIDNQGFLERWFESGLWNSRFFVILAVVFGLISSLLLFFIASSDIYSAMQLAWGYYIQGNHVEHFHELILGKIIGSVDSYLIGIVLLIFSFGTYELFISQVDVSEGSENSGALEVHSLEELKDKITKVVIMVLVVNFFQRVIVMEYATALDMLYLAVAICLLAVGLYFLHKNERPG